MKNELKENIDNIISKKISSSVLKQILQSADLRDEFILKYQYFHNDGNKSVYKQWIEDYLLSKKNVVLEHIFDISNFTDIFLDALITKSEEVLRNRYWELTKLACLNYLISQKHKIGAVKLMNLSKVARKHTTNEIVKFQASINLLAIDKTENLSFVCEILNKTDYPTLFYRLINQICLLEKSTQIALSKYLFTAINEKEFMPNVKNELLNAIPQ